MATPGVPVSPPPTQSMKPAVAYFNTEKKGEINELKQVELIMFISLSAYLLIYSYNMHTKDIYVYK